MAALTHAADCARFLVKNRVFQRHADAVVFLHLNQHLHRLAKPRHALIIAVNRQHRAYDPLFFHDVISHSHLLHHVDPRFLKPV